MKKREAQKNAERGERFISDWREAKFNPPTISLIKKFLVEFMQFFFFRFYMD